MFLTVSCVNVLVIHTPGEEYGVLKTIIIGSCVSVQGILVKALDNGKVVVRVGDHTYEGRPVSSKAAA